MQLDPFKEYRDRWGIKEADEYHRPHAPPLPPSDKDWEEEIEIDDSHGIDLISNGDGQPFTNKKGVGFAVHIVEVRLMSSDIRNSEPYEDGIPKVHLVQCGTINRMINENRWERYRASHRGSEFLLTTIDGKDERKDLNICLNCLKSQPLKIFIRGINLGITFRLIGRINRSFSTRYSKDIIEKFLKDHSFPRSAPRDIDASPPKNIYALMQIYKRQKNWKCENCKVDLSSPLHRQLLHCHHKDQNWRNNDFGNYRALCFKCHSDEHPLEPRFRRGYKAEENLYKILRIQQEQRHSS